MSDRPVKNYGKIQEERNKKAHGIMSEIRASLHRRLADYVLNNESQIRSETRGEDSYSFCLQQMEELFLNKLTVVERTVAEMGRSDSQEGQPVATTYEAVELIAKRDELPQKVADALAEHGDSDFLDLIPLRIDNNQAEVLLVMAREEIGMPTPLIAKVPEVPLVTNIPKIPDGMDRVEESDESQDSTDVNQDDAT